MRIGKRQREVIERMLGVPGSFLVYHVKPNGRKCFRLMAPGSVPIVNYRIPLIRRLIGKGVLVKKGSFPCKYFIKNLFYNEKIA